MMKIRLTPNVVKVGASPIGGMEKTMDDYTFPFLLSLAMAVVLLVVAVAHGVGL